MKSSTKPCNCLKFARNSVLRDSPRPPIARNSSVAFCVRKWTNGCARSRLRVLRWTERLVRRRGNNGLFNEPTAGRFRFVYCLLTSVGVHEFLSVSTWKTCPRRRASLATNDRRSGQVGATGAMTAGRWRLVSQSRYPWSSPRRRLQGGEIARSQTEGFFNGSCLKFRADRSLECCHYL